MTWSLVVAMLAAWVVQWRLPPEDLAALQRTLGLRPAVVLAALERARTLGFGVKLLAELDELALRAVLPFLSYSLLHAGVVHTIVNAAVLRLVGARLEARASAVRWAAFYFLAAVAAGVTHVALRPAAEAPAMGASGAVGAAVAAWIACHPRVRVVVAVPVVVVPVMAQLPGAFLALGWAALQFRPVRMLLAVGEGEPLEWVALAAAAVVGLAAAPWLLRAPRG